MLQSGRVNYWTGDECRLFEAEYARSIGVNHAIALANGTVALELALIALGLQPGDEVIVTPRSFIASASSVAICGGIPVFADVDENSQNIHASSIEAAITPRTRGIIAVHLAGWPCEMDEILQLAYSSKLFVIEDCAQAHGARYRRTPVGSLGDVAAISFCQDKIITTGGRAESWPLPTKQSGTKPGVIRIMGKAMTQSTDESILRVSAGCTSPLVQIGECSRCRLPLAA